MGAHSRANVLVKFIIPARAAAVWLKTYKKVESNTVLRLGLSKNFPKDLAILVTVFPLISVADTSFKALRCGVEGQDLKEGGAYFKARKFICMVLQTFQILSFQMTINN